MPAMRRLCEKVLTMDMVDLILTVCLIAHPGQCREEHLYFQREGPALMRCMSLAPSELAKWAEEHPALRIMRWKCAYPDSGRTL